jgi:Porin PorA
MRRIIGLVFIALGVTLIALAIALPTYVYPRVAHVYANPNQTLVAQGTGITVLLPRSLDAGGTRILTDQTVTNVRRVVGQIPPNGAKVQHGDAFYRLAYSVNVEGQGLLLAYVEGGSINGKTGLSNNKYGDYYNTDPTDPVNVPIKHAGLQFKFPFNTQRHNYPFWDVFLKKATTARYDGTEKINGLLTYRFVQPITDVVISQDDVPGALIGLPDQPSVRADRLYSTTRTLWIEPYTGAIIKGSERINQRLVSNGKVAPVIQGTLTYTPATIKANVDKYQPLAAGLRFVTKIGPIGGWILGPVSILIGFTLLALSRGEDDEYDDTWDDEDDEDEDQNHPSSTTNA